MKQAIIISALLIASITAFGQSIEEEKEAIKKCIQTAYIEGLQNEGDKDKIDSGIHPHFHLLGIDHGDEIWALSINDWTESTLKKKKKGELPRTGDKIISANFLMIDITGNAAIVKLEFLQGETPVYIDYISLYKFESGWKMVNKIFHKL